MRRLRFVIRQWIRGDGVANKIAMPAKGSLLSGENISSSTKQRVYRLDQAT